MSAGGKLSSFLFTVAAQAGDAPALAQNLFWEVNDISAALGHLQDYVLERAAVPRERGAMILLEHLQDPLVTAMVSMESIIAGIND